jgi:hypothetical protein
MGTLHELYKLLLGQMEEEATYDLKVFICLSIRELTISKDEQYALIQHFKSQKPTQKRHSEFFNHPNFQGSYSWWDNDTPEKAKESFNQRILFIQKMIEITKQV